MTFISAGSGSFSNSPQPLPEEIERAATLLMQGELVAFPTETVYGLGADAANPQAVRKIFAVKGRPADHPLIVHLAASDHVAAWAGDIPEMAWELIEAFWPGPLTLILKRNPQAVEADAVTGGQDTIGLRMPGHPVALDLLRAFAGKMQAAGKTRIGIAAPSANRFGRISPTQAHHVIEELGRQVAMVLDGGPCRVGIESTILDLSTGRPRLLRPGAITPAAIFTVCGIEPELVTQQVVDTNGDGSGGNDGSGESSDIPRASGTLLAHYAPETPLQIVERQQLPAAIDAAHAWEKNIGIICRQAPEGVFDSRYCLVLPESAPAYAQQIYAALRRLDQDAVEIILVEALPDDAEWAAVADRLRRAAKGSGSGKPGKRK